jgi:hypothetical protein
MSAMSWASRVENHRLPSRCAVSTSSRTGRGRGAPSCRRCRPTHRRGRGSRRLRAWLRPGRLPGLLHAVRRCAARRGGLPGGRRAGRAHPRGARRRADQRRTEPGCRPAAGMNPQPTSERSARGGMSQDGHGRQCFANRAVALGPRRGQRETPRTNAFGAARPRKKMRCGTGSADTPVREVGSPAGHQPRSHRHARHPLLRWRHRPEYPVRNRLASLERTRPPGIVADSSCLRGTQLRCGVRRPGWERGRSGNAPGRRGRPARRHRRHPRSWGRRASRDRWRQCRRH